jgi:hypothetical protein
VEWVLLISLEWVVLGSPTIPTTMQITPFASEELCKKLRRQSRLKWMRQSRASVLRFSVAWSVLLRRKSR